MFEEEAFSRTHFSSGFAYNFVYSCYIRVSACPVSLYYKRKIDSAVLAIFVPITNVDI